MKKQQRLGEQLIGKGVLTEEQLEKAFAFQKEVGGSLGEVLMRLGLVNADDLLAALGEQQDVPWVNLAHVEIPAAVLALVKPETARARRLLPIEKKEGHLVVGMVDPTDVAAVTEAQFQASLPVQPVLVSTNQLEQALDLLDDRGWGKEPLRLGAEPGAQVQVAGDLTSLLKLLVAWNGQDLHLSAGAIPAIRMDNEMKRLTLPPLDPTRLEALLLPILTPAQREAFVRDLELDFAYSLEGVGRFRCNLYRQRGALAFTARYVSERIPSAAQLGLPESIHEYVLHTQGLILVTGPNGHGKSTTLAYLVEHINRSRKANIITIEDPIEYTYRHKLSNVNQREVGADTRSFGEGLRRIYRQNPDVIVIGELRDRESFEIALNAAGTGHLVLGTMHSLNATSALDRFIEMFPGDQQVQVRGQLADCLLLVLSQRLVRRAGGSGRILALERMATSHRVRNAIREGKSHQMRSLMQMHTEEFDALDDSLAALVNAGRVRLDEALRWAENPGHFAELARVRATPKT